MDTNTNSVVPAVKIPYVIQCNVTGNLITYTNKAFVLRKLANFGSEAHMKEVFVCKHARKLLAEGKTVAEVIAALNGSKKPEEVDLTKLQLKKMVGKRVKKEEVTTSSEPVTTETPAPVVEATPETPATTDAQETPETPVPVKKAAKKSKKAAKAPTAPEVAQA